MTKPLPSQNNDYPFLKGGGEMGQLTRAYNWEKSVLGAPETWPQSLKITLGIILNSKFPMFLFWGPELICFYNDAFRPSLGNNGKHPAVGMRGEDCWAEIWDTIKPLIDQVLSGGEAIWSEDQLIPIYRNGKIEDVYWTFSYSPVIDEQGIISGLSVICSETTDKVLAFRQLEENNKQLQLSGEAEAIAQKRIKENENNLRLVILQAPVAIAIFRGPQYVVEIVNPLALELWGRKSVEVLNKPILDAMPELRSQGIEALLDNVYQTGEAFSATELPVKISRKGKTETAYINFVYEALYDSDGKINGLITIGTEVTEQVLVRKAIQESEERFRTMAEGTDIMIDVTDEDGNSTYFNKAWVDFTGRPVYELTKKGWTDLIHPADNKRQLSVYLPAIKKKIAFKNEFRILDQSGHYRWIFTSGTPRFSPDGAFAGYIGSSIDITDRKTSEEQKQQLLFSVKSNEQKLAQVLNLLPAHVLVLRGTELLIESLNDAVLSFWQKSKDIIGKPLLQILPELEGQPFPEQLAHVLATGETISIKESPVEFEDPSGNKRTNYVDYSYQPLTNAHGERTGILVMSFEVTDKVESRKLLEKYAKELQAINDEAAAANEELVSTNEELAAVNEEMAATNEELTETQASLQQTFGDLTLSELRFRSLVQGAPVAIGVLNGRELVIESANDLMVQIWGKSEYILGMPLAVALPELQGQPFLKILDNVYTSGVAHYGYEAKAILEHNGELREGYFDFIYQPLNIGNSAVNTIMVVAIDVTAQVKNRKATKWAEEQLRLAIDSAEMATWYLNIKTGEFSASPRLKEFFGYHADEDMSLSAGIDQIAEEYREKVSQAVQNTIDTGASYNLEYPVIGHHNQKLRWLKAMGRVYKTDDNNENFFGVIIDITESKQDELRKNDFIGMVSHELKTPLTSLSAYVQMLKQRSQKSEDDFTTSALEKLSIQVKKMTTMINGFLNLSRLESGKIHLEKQSFELNRLVTDMISDAQLSIPAHQIVFTAHDPITLVADRDKIGSVISNLLSNSVKYSPKGNDITVTCKVVGNNARVSVTDEGIGIKPKDIDKLFERYYRVEGPDNRHISGFGIGLYLSAEIIERHHGSIWAESEWGKGSTFYFTLPLER